MKALRLFRLTVPALAVIAAFSAPAIPAIAQVTYGADQGFSGYLQLVAARARREGVSEQTITRMTSGLTVNPRVIALDQSQPGSDPSSGTFAPFAPYYRDHVDAARINGGKRTVAANSDIIPRIEAQYGVPGKIIVAIWGHETNYGSYKGDFDLARSLATLAYEGRRRDLFEGEFIALMKMIDRGVPRERLYGSWAGAFGNPQFLPSVYLRVARDGDGDGDADIWNDRADTLASIANYFRDAGWRRGEPWGVRAFVPSSLDRNALATRLNAPACPRVHVRHSVWKPVSEWRAMGVIPQASIADSTMAALLEPDGVGNGGYLLTGNYRVILQYNCSNYYALSVGLLADEIAR